MATYKLIKLKNLTPIHIGTGKENYDFSADNLKSDTISSALAAIRAQKGKTDDLEKFLSSFSVSSAFPFWENYYFLPKVYGKVDVKIRGEEEHNYRKKLKGVKYIESSLWNQLIQGKGLIINKEQINKEFIVDNAKFEKLSIAEVGQRVTVPRDEESKSDPFFFEWKFYDSRAGLFCIIDCEDAVFEEIVSLFKELGQTGLGTDKNVGGGKFDVEESKIVLPDVKDTTHQLSLSMYLPKEEEIKRLNLEKSRYELVLRGGYVAGSSNTDFRHLRKKSVYMFNTGAVFATNHDLNGKIVDLRPEWNDESMHPVFRSGIPFYIPIKLNENE